MSYGRVEAFLRSTPWYLVVFVLSLGSVAAVAEYFVVRSVQSKEQALVTGRLEEYRAEFEAGGVSGLANAVAANESPGTDFVRLSKGQLTVYEHKARPDLDGPPSHGGVARDPRNPQSNTEKRSWRIAVTEVSGNLQLPSGAQQRAGARAPRSRSQRVTGSPRECAIGGTRRRRASRASGAITHTTD